MYNGLIKIINHIPLLREYGITDYMKNSKDAYDLDEGEYYQVEPLLTGYLLTFSNAKGYTQNDTRFRFQIPRHLLRDSYRHRHIVCVPC